LDLILFYFIVDAKMPLSPSTTEEPAYLRDDPGLACLASQLERINKQIQCLDQFKKKIITVAEGQCKQVWRPLIGR
jgi:hypothetical protein